MELKGLFPAVAASQAAGGNPEVLAVAEEVGPVPIAFSNYMLPLAAYQLLSANSLSVTIGLVLNLYGTVGYSTRYSLLPVGTQLPGILTLPAAHASSLFMMSEEGIRWKGITALYDPLFVHVQDNNLPIFTIRPLLTPSIADSTSVPSSVVSGQGEQNPAFPLGTPVYTVSQDRQSNIWTNSRPIYVLNNCDPKMTEMLCHYKEKLSKETLRRRVAVDFHTCAFYQ